MREGTPTAGVRLFSHPPTGPSHLQSTTNPSSHIRASSTRFLPRCSWQPRIFLSIRPTLDTVALRGLQTSAGSRKDTQWPPILGHCSFALMSRSSYTDLLTNVLRGRVPTSGHWWGFSSAFGSPSSSLTQRSPSQIPDFLSLGIPLKSSSNQLPCSLSSSKSIALNSHCLSSLSEAKGTWHHKGA